jgi:magnesium-transporting ATPase (P-type)
MGWFSNRMLWLGIVSELLIVSFLIYVPFFQHLFGTAGFAPVNWLFLFAWTPSLLLADEVRKALLRRRERKKKDMVKIGGNV